MPHVVTGIADAITTLALNHERRRDALRPALSLRSVGNGLKLRPEFRALRRAPWRRVPTGAPAAVGTGCRLRFVYALRSKAFSLWLAIRPSSCATKKWCRSTLRRKIGPATAPRRPP